jgi:hypothetical protein
MERRLCISQLRSSFLDRYPADWLERIGCGFIAVNESWLERLFRKPLAPQSTLRHLLLIDFLELSVETVLCSEHSLPFGPAPWPCLNRACGHFGEAIVPKCEISCTRNGESLSGRFSCPACGMSYIRLGPDRCPEDRHHRDWIPVHGANRTAVAPSRTRAVSAATRRSPGGLPLCTGTFPALPTTARKRAVR